MAELLFEYNDRIDTAICGVHSCFVTAKDNRFMKLPVEIINYRRPSKEFIACFLKPVEESTDKG